MLATLKAVGPASWAPGRGVCVWGPSRCSGTYLHSLLNWGWVGGAEVSSLFLAPISPLLSIGNDLLSLPQAHICQPPLYPWDPHCFPVSVPCLSFSSTLGPPFQCPSHDSWDFCLSSPPTPTPLPGLQVPVSPGSLAWEGTVPPEESVMASPLQLQAGCPGNRVRGPPLNS